MDPNLEPGDDTLGDPNLESGDETLSDSYFGEPANLNTGDDTVHLAKGELKVGTTFPSYRESCRSVQEYFDNNYEPLVIRSSDDGKVKEGRRGRIQIVCSHGYHRKSKASSSRPHQAINFTNCLAGVNINEQATGEWRVTKANFQHSGHLVGPDVYGSYAKQKKLDEETEDYVEELAKAGAAPRNIADCLNAKTGKRYQGKDVTNIISRLKQKVDDGGILEEHLREIVQEKGEVLWHKNRDTGYVEVLYIQTASMRSDIERTRPYIWQCDTTFSTNK